jgi:hypothetical protein
MKAPMDKAQYSEISLEDGAKGNARETDTNKVAIL